MLTILVVCAVAVVRADSYRVNLSVLPQLREWIVPLVNFITRGDRSLICETWLPEIRLPMTLIAVIVLLGLTSVPGSAQSLGDLAKQTQAARDKAKADPATKVDEPKKFTDDDLKPLTPVPGGVTSTSESSATPSTTTPSPVPTTSQPTSSSTYTPSEKRDQEYWFGRMRGLLTQLDTDTIARTAADGRERQYRAEMDATEVSRDGGVYIDRIAKQRYLDARDEASRLRAAVDADKAATAALEEEARKANVPPGWLRR